LVEIVTHRCKKFSVSRIQGRSRPTGTQRRGKKKEGEREEEGKFLLLPFLLLLIQEIQEVLDGPGIVMELNLGHGSHGNVMEKIKNFKWSWNFLFYK
jgi:hypothetical protein